jgi:hypothetical protein
MVHLTSGRRAEIVLFGDDVLFRGPFTLPIGTEYTVKVPASGSATLTRIVKVKDEWVERQVNCSADVGSVLIALGQMGGGYAEAVELIRRADAAGVLSSSVLVDAIPLELNLRQLAYFARHDPSLRKADAEVSRLGVSRPSVENADLTLPTPDADSTPPPTPPPRPPLNREPGRLFGPKRQEPPVAPTVLPTPRE